MFAAASDAVLAVLLSSFTYQPIFGWRPSASARHVPDDTGEGRGLIGRWGGPLASRWCRSLQDS